MPTPTGGSSALSITYDWLSKRIHHCCEELGVEIQPHTISKDILERVAVRYNADLRRACNGDDGPDIFKQAGYITFWIRKLKPLHTDNSKVAHLNETIGIYLGLALICSLPEHVGHIRKAARSAYPNALREFMELFGYSLRYRPISPHAIGLIYYAIWNLTVMSAPMRSNRA